MKEDSRHGEKLKYTKTIFFIDLASQLRQKFYLITLTLCIINIFQDLISHA